MAADRAYARVPGLETEIQNPDRDNVVTQRIAQLEGIGVSTREVSGVNTFHWSSFTVNVDTRTESLRRRRHIAFGEQINLLRLQIEVTPFVGLSR